MRINRWIGCMSGALLALITTITGAPSASAAEIRLANGAVWSGEVGAKVRVLYQDGDESVPFDGVVVEAAEDFVAVKGIDGSLLRLVALSDPARPASGSGSPGQPAGRTSGRSAGGAASAATPRAAAARWVAVYEVEDARLSVAGGGIARPRVYIVPIAGQIGTDVSPELVDGLLRDIKKVRPDVLVHRMNCADFDRINHLANDRIEEAGIPDPELVRDMVKRLQEEMPDARQVMWVEDAVGVSAFMALAWSEMYFHPDARIGGVSRFIDQVKERWSDPDVRSKMLAARLGLFKGLVVQGGHAECIAEAMLLPENKLSFEFVGRRPRWRGDDKGMIIVDSSEEQPANFHAEAAELSFLCDGLAESLDDLMYLLGYREYEVVSRGERIATSHRESWRKGMDGVLDILDEAAATEDDVAGFGRRKSLFEKALAILRRYPFMEMRMELQQRQVNAEVLEIYIDDIRKIIQQMNEAEKDAKRNGGRGGSSGGGGRGLGSPRG
jgi:hypothetical protein